MIESNSSRRNCLKDFIKVNGLIERVQLIEKNLTDFESKDLETIDVRAAQCGFISLRCSLNVRVCTLQFDIIFSEVVFSSGLLPWDNIYFYYCLEHLRQVMSGRGDSKSFDRVTVLPKRLKIKLIGIEMENLHKIRCPVGDFDGIKLDEFDEIILVR